MFDKINNSILPFLEMTGYEPKTTFWSDFGIAEVIGGIKAVQDTYKRAFNEWKNDVVYLTELVMVLNWKSWQYAESDVNLAMAYQKLWEEADQWCLENLKDDDKRYFLRTTD